jgi:hypothetical protein
MEGATRWQKPGYRTTDTSYDDAVAVLLLFDN